MSKNLIIFSLSAMLSGLVSSVGCSSSNDPCARKTCDQPLVCDPGDGVCKCGGRGGVVCPDGFACDPVANTCLSTKCVQSGRRVDCSMAPGTSCDLTDGKCKCGGTGGRTCAANERCDPAAKACVATINCSQITCPRNQTCDPASGQCLCAGMPCSGAKVCSVADAGAPLCVDSICAGVTCSGSNACDTADGFCKCNGVICQSGESCACPANTDGGCMASARTCRTSSLCSQVNCSSGTTCDPVDGLCKCGGPGGPVCGTGQLCALGPPPTCQGGMQCLLPDGGARLCTGGTSCDPEDGRCKCGGRGGVVCAPAVAADGGPSTAAEVCVQSPVQTACRRGCDVRQLDCPAGQFCYYDSTAATAVAYCAPAPTMPRGEDDGCTSPTQCFVRDAGPALHCNGLVLGQTGTCRPYCDTMAGSSGCIQVPRPQSCVQIVNGPAGFGFCQQM
jgi:hypothetical protein